MPAAAKSPKRRRGRLKMSTSCSYSPFPGPRYGGRPPEMYPKISGAQNLSGVPVFNPGHWALGEQKFQSVRFHCRAWLCRTNAPSPFSAVGAAPCGRPSLAFPLQGGRWLAEGQTDEGGPETAENPQQAAKVPGLCGKAGVFPVFRRGGSLHPPAVSPPHNLSPTTPKGALSTDRRNPQR